MNIVEQHAKMDLWLDRPRSARFQPGDRDSALISAADRILRDNYDNIRKETGYSFQSVQRLRDQLRSLIVSSTVVPTGNVITYPADYRHELLVQVTLNGIITGSRPTTYDEIESIKANPFEKPELEHPRHLEIGNTAEVFFGTYGTFSAATIHYIKQPVDVFRGTTSIIASPTALTVGVLYYVEVGPVTHNSVIYQAGQTFTAVNTTLTGAGSVIVIVNSELPANMHEEQARVAASILSGDSGDYNRKGMLESENNQS